MSELGCCKGECDVQKERVKRRQMLLGPDFVSTSGVIGSAQQWQSVKCGDRHRLESCSQGMATWLCSWSFICLCGWRPSTLHTAPKSLSDREEVPHLGWTLAVPYAFLSHFWFFPVLLRWGFIWLASTLGFLLGLWFSSVSQELLTYLVSGSVLDISVVWNCSSRSKNGVCAIVNLMTEWRDIISFVLGGIFFLLTEGPTWKHIGLILSLWTGTYNWKMIAFTYLVKAEFWYGLEREYDYRNYKEMVGKVISPWLLYWSSWWQERILLYFYLSWGKTLRCDHDTTAALLSLAPTAAAFLVGCRQAELEVERSTGSSDKHSHRQHLPSS